MRKPFAATVGLICCICFFTGCDSDDTSGSTAEFPGDARLLGMWAEPRDDPYQDFVYMAFDEEENVLRYSLWEQNYADDCVLADVDFAILASGVTATSITFEGETVRYTFSNGGSTLTFTYSDEEEEPSVLTRNDRTPASMTPECSPE